MHSSRRKMAEAYTAAGIQVWSFRFDAPMWNAKAMKGANHGAEIAFTSQIVLRLWLLAGMSGFKCGNWEVLR